jgi:hypothetical protein
MEVCSMEAFKAIGAALFLAGITSAAMAGEKSAPAKVQPVASTPSTTSVVAVAGDCACGGVSASGRTTFAERRAARVEGRSSKRGACCGSCASTASTNVAVTETPAVIRKTETFQTQTRKVGQKVEVLPGSQVK